MKPKPLKTIRGTSARYPWSVWMQPGGVHIFKEGVDFGCSMRSFIVYLYTVARRMERRVEVSQVSPTQVHVRVFRKERKSA
jgi:hypothetical protein